MSEALALTGSDRLLILAPHPDDESIATGGLVQHAREAGAAVRIAVLTDGDNNPWPQRWIEKRWRIDAAARARWGARRRAEARTAMRILGLGEPDVRFFGFPDLGLTDLLMRNDAGIVAALGAMIAEFAPTRLVLPALSDRHPDHSAAHILARIALATEGAAATALLAFAVHGQREHEDVALVLGEAQRAVKRSAILAHETQMRLSRDRFLRYAGDRETYWYAPAVERPNPAHPVRGVFGEGRLHIRIDLRQWRDALHGHALFIALANGQRLLARLRPWSGVADVLDTAAGEDAGRAELRTERSEVRVSLPCESSRGYVKLALPRPGWRVFDRFGWQPIDEPEQSGRLS